MCDLSDSFLSDTLCSSSQPLATHTSLHHNHQPSHSHISASLISFTPSPYHSLSLLDDSRVELDVSDHLGSSSLHVPPHAHHGAASSERSQTKGLFQPITVLAHPSVSIPSSPFLSPPPSASLCGALPLSPSLSPLSLPDEPPADAHMTPLDINLNIHAPLLSSSNTMSHSLLSAFRSLDSPPLVASSSSSYASAYGESRGLALPLPRSMCSHASTCSSDTEESDNTNTTNTTIDSWQANASPMPFARHDSEALLSPAASSRPDAFEPMLPVDPALQDDMMLEEEPIKIDCNFNVQSAMLGDSYLTSPYTYIDSFTTELDCSPLLLPCVTPDTMAKSNKGVGRGKYIRKKTIIDASGQKIVIASTNKTAARLNPTPKKPIKLQIVTRKNSFAGTADAHANVPVQAVAINALTTTMSPQFASASLHPQSPPAVAAVPALLPMAITSSPASKARLNKLKLSKADSIKEEKVEVVVAKSLTRASSKKIEQAVFTPTAVSIPIVSP